jgi:hypothetical protein
MTAATEIPFQKRGCTGRCSSVRASVSSASSLAEPRRDDPAPLLLREGSGEGAGRCRCDADADDAGGGSGGRGAKGVVAPLAAPPAAGVTVTARPAGVGACGVATSGVDAEAVT